MTPTTSDSKFRADLNGLRAVAVIAVLLFHFRIAPFAGGFVGVDVFFVISGFLMTQIIATGLATGRFDFFRFYLNRIARIVPALLSLSLVCLAIGYYILPPAQYAQIAQEALNAVTFKVNFFYANDTGYFAPTAAERWFLHCWSLAVEFQFYVLLPLILWAANHFFKKNGVLLALLLVVPASMICSFLQTNSDPVAAFYLLPARAWEFAIGGLVLFLPSLPPRYRNFAALLGLVAITSVALVFNEALAYPSLWSAFPALGAALVIWARSSFYGLTNPVCQFIGRISYSLYLWHWPTLIIAHYFDYGGKPVEVAVLFAITLISAWLSFVFIESPFRQVFRSPSWGRLAPFTTAALAAVGACVTIGATNGWPSRLSAQMADVAQRSSYHGEFRDGSCFLRPEQGFSDFNPACFDPDRSSHKPTLAIWGSSHAAHLYSGIAKQPWADNYKILQLTASACTPLPASVDPGRPHCALIQKSIRAFLAQSKPDILVMAVPRAAVSEVPMADVPASVLTRSGLQMTIRSLLHDGIGRVVIVGPTPEWTMPLPQIYFRESVFNAGARENSSAMLKPAELAKIDQQYKDAIAPTGAIYISMRDLLCKEDRCTTMVPNWPTDVLIQFDQNHLTADGSDWVAQHKIGPALGMPVMPVKSAPLGERLEFNENGPARKYLTSGWMPPEGWGTWTADSSRPGIINIPIDRRHPPSGLRIKFSGILGESLPVENFTIKINDDLAMPEKILQAYPIVERVLPISLEAQRLMREHGRLKIAFYAPEGKSPNELGINSDTRVLGLGLRELTLIP